MFTIAASQREQDCLPEISLSLPPLAFLSLTLSFSYPLSLKPSEHTKYSRRKKVYICSLYICSLYLLVALLNCYRNVVTAWPPSLSHKTIIGIHGVRCIKKKEACRIGWGLCKGAEGNQTQAVTQGATEVFCQFPNIFQCSETVPEIPSSTNYIH